MNHLLKGRENKRTLQNTNKKSMGMLNFNQYLKENSKASHDAAGVAIIYNNKILLIHPTNASWKRGTCGIPKGGIEPGEDLMEAALRELREETGIILQPEQLEPSSESVHISRKNVEWMLFYFICKITDLSEIGLDSERLPNDMLQLEEIDWGKFVTAEEAYPIMTRAQLIILDRHLTLDQNK
jgi:8-oxo-dGTP pyrophosphatase MutT (NUDIX family)